jgi:hypothetical protein
MAKRELSLFRLVLDLTFKMLLLVSLLSLGTEWAKAGPTKVGNGDDGGDLEGGQRISTGILIETQREAAQLLRGLQVQGIEGLGTLIPETEKADLYLAEQDPSPQAKTNAETQAELKEIAQAIGASEPYVYARTFSEPHAPTRFFPKALLLDRKNLVALHVHEALHRALPAEIRENEKSVSRITLAITAAGATRDRVQETVSKELASAREARQEAERAQRQATSALPIVPYNANFAAASSLPPGPELKSPSLFAYNLKSYVLPDPDKSLAPLRSMHSLRSFLYPFGRGSEALGLGIEFSYLQAQDEAYLGPVGLSGRMKLLTWRGFDVDGFGALRLHSVGSGELKDSPMGRDVLEVGVSLKRDEKWYMVENKLSVHGGSKAEQKIGAVQYTHDYGSIVEAGIAAALRLPMLEDGDLELGGSTQVLLAQNTRVKGGAFDYETGRLRVVTAGPEVAWNQGALRFSANARFVIDSTKGASLDQLGDLMGHGVGQGSIGAGLSFKF